MRTMSGSPCLHYDCSNRNSFGYCKTTVCINEHYQQEQWGSPSTTNKSEGVVIKPQTNADRLRQMSDEGLATFFGTLPCCPPGNADELCFPDDTCGADTKMMEKCWANWLKSPVEEVDNGT